MCGIAGIMQTRPSKVLGLPLAAGGAISARDAIAQMVGALAHRGPDGCGVECRANPHCGGDVVLGHTRLAIIDPSSGGAQPMGDPANGNCISYNGEVYNYRELRRTLASAIEPELAHTDLWRSQSDTEVVLRAYARWGADCVHWLRGMFAFALWDARQQRLFLVRDRLGIKPLYYYAGEGFFLFASEVRALLASGLVPRELDPVAVGQYLAYQAVPAPRTMVRGVCALPAGTSLTIDAGGAQSLCRYWNPLDDADPQAAGADRASAARRLGELLREAVALHLVSDVPVAAFLSGGIDSSALVGLMRERGVVPRTYTVGFKERAYDETSYARRVATRFATDHTEILLDEGDLLDQLPDALAAMDQPSGDGINTYVIARAVREAGVAVALSGLGGDELFGGYASFARMRRAAPFLQAWAHAPRPVRTAVAGAVRGRWSSSTQASKIAALLESDGSPATALPVFREVLTRAQRRDVLQPAWIDAVDVGDDPYVSSLRSAFRHHPGTDPFTCTSYAEMTTYMHDVLLHDADQMSMAHALEVRVPLLDHRVVEYVMGLAAAVKQPGGTPKRLLVESLRGLLPTEVVGRPKQGFALPFAPWMRGPLRGFCAQHLTPDRLGARGIFDTVAVERLWHAFLEGRPGASWSRVWVLVALESWAERNGL